MAFRVPNEVDAGVPDQAELDSFDLSIIAAGSARTGIVSGCAVTAQGSPDMTLAVAAGIHMVKGIASNVAAGNVTITAAHATLDRYDLVLADNAGTKSVLAGTPAANPVFPTAGMLDADGNLALDVFAAVRVPAAATSIVASNIIDKRVFIKEPAGLLNVKDYGAVGDATTDDGPAFAAAIAATAVFYGIFGGGIYIPPGIYMIGQQLNLPSPGANVGFTVLGSDKRTTVLRPHANFATSQAKNSFILSFDGAGTLRYGPSMRGFTVQGVRDDETQNDNADGRMPNVNGIRVHDAGFFHWKDIDVEGFRGTGIDIQGCLEWTWQGIYVNACGVSGDSGVCDANNSATPGVLTDAARNWEVNQWAGEKLLMVTGNRAGLVFTIASNTGTTLTMTAAWGGSGIATGDKYHIVAMGTATGAGQSTTVLRDSSKTWVANMWVGWFVTIVSGPARAETARISANDTSGNLTLERTLSTAPVAASSKYIIWKPNIAIWADDGDTFAPSNCHTFGCQSTRAYGPLIALWGGTSAERTSGIHFNDALIHGETPYTWPYPLVYAEDTWNIRFNGGKVGPGPDAENLFHNVGTSWFQFIAGRYTSEVNTVEGMHLHSGGVATGTVYGILFDEVVANSNLNGHVGPNGWGLAATGLTALVRDNTNPTQNDESPVIFRQGVNPAESYRGKVISKGTNATPIDLHGDLDIYLRSYFESDFFATFGAPAAASGGAGGEQYRYWSFSGTAVEVIALRGGFVIPNRCIHGELVFRLQFTPAVNNPTGQVTWSIDTPNAENIPLAANFDYTAEQDSGTYTYAGTETAGLRYEQVVVTTSSGNFLEGNFVRFDVISQGAGDSNNDARRLVNVDVYFRPSA